MNQNNILYQLEQERLEALAHRRPYRIYAISVILIFAIVLVGMIWMDWASIPVYFMIGFVSLVAFFILLSIGERKVKQYRINYYQSVVTDIVKSYGEFLIYKPTAGISYQSFRKSRLFDEDIDYFKGSHLIEGYYKKTFLKVSRVHAENETSDSEGNRRKSTVFKGLFLVADMKANFRGHTFILPDTAEKFLGPWAGRKLQQWFGRSELVVFDDPGFEREFVVYSDDPTAARTLLTPKLLENIHYVNHYTGGKVYISFHGSIFFMAIPSYGSDPMQIPIHRPADDPALMEKLHKEIHSWISLIDELELTRDNWQNKTTATE